MNHSPDHQIEQLAVSLGEKLRRQRLEAGLSLETASADLKIMVRHLKALEEGSVAKLPSMIAGRGFLKNYARYLRLNVQETLAEFDALAEKMSPKKIYPGGNLPKPNHFNYFAYGAVLLLVLIVLSAWLRRNPAPPALEHKLAQESAAVGVLPADLPPVGELAPAQIQAALQPATDQVPKVEPATAADNKPKPLTLTIATKPPAPPPPSAPPSGHVFVLETTDKCWLDVVVDGQRVYQETLPAGSRQTWTVKRSLALKVGNAGGLRVYQNGQLLPPLGGQGEVAKKEYNP